MLLSPRLDLFFGLDYEIFTFCTFAKNHQHIYANKIVLFREQKRTTTYINLFGGYLERMVQNLQITSRGKLLSVRAWCITALLFSFILFTSCAKVNGIHNIIEGFRSFSPLGQGWESDTVLFTVTMYLAEVCVCVHPLPNSSLFLLEMNPSFEKIRRFNTDSSNSLPLLTNKKSDSPRKGTNHERLNRNLTFVLLLHLCLATIKPNHRLNGVKNMPSRPAIKIIIS